MSQADWTPPTYKHNYFLVYIPDVPNAQRSKHHDAHIKHSLPLIQNGTIKLGGALLPQTSKTTDPDVLKNVIGSWIILRAESIEKAWETIKQDPFYTSGEVWDTEKITVTPAYTGMPEVKFD
ncbi:hypothetical protein PYCCODRAFT_1417111 [Trametes coccinea BRFM310]|uniref:YCII-related domain-containing protein n=1 Tax=Trametes coccinea (strain BRFM310) TaxID=1353009 RepID=A0A1Y2ICB4_TRAC3|nr:hypothetical protein PYCCODRAFT_1417111 [Trametes coccinea BRFM310]